MTSPALAFASVSSVFKVQTTLCLRHGVPGTLSANGLEVPIAPRTAAYRLPDGAKL